MCEGRCAKRFHCECVSVSEDQMCAFTTNILWICDGCLKDFHKYRERVFTDSATDASPDTSVQDAILDLKSTVSGIVETLAKVIQKTGTIAPHSSTPVSSPKLFDGTAEIFGNASDNNGTQEASEERRDFSLYLTRIDRCVTETDISHLVSRSLAAPLSSCSNVVKLVPKWKDVSNLDYVSFKIVLNAKWKSKALSVSTWPRRVKFREFFDRSDETWKPN